VLRVLVVGPEDLSDVIGPTVIGRPDIDRIHEPQASSAIQTAERARPHMVVIDLPRIEAGQAARRLRENPTTRPTAIVWLNRSDPPDVEGELKAAGVNAVIPLPIDPFLWDRRLEELLSVPARRARRIPVRLLDWSRFMVSADEDEATILNIGARGVLLETARALDLGTKVGLSLRLPGDATDVAVVGQVVRQAGGEEGLHRVGVEFLVYRGDSRERIAAFVDAEPEPDRPGAPAAAVPMIVRPFQEAREWEEELRASELRKALILDSALDCIVTVDHEGRIVEFNSAARRVFGYTRSEVLGREVGDTLVPPALRDELRRRLRDFVLTGESEDLGRRREAVAMRADGSILPVEIVVVPAYVKGRVLLTAYIRDVTDRHRGRRLAEARHRVTQALTGSLSLAEAAPAVLDALVQGLDCLEARLWVVEGEPTRLDLAGTSTPSREVGRGEAPDETLARRVLAAGQPVWIAGEGGEDAGSALAVPVRAGGEVLGVLEAFYARAQPRDDEWVGVVGDVGSQVGLFLRRQRAEADLQRLGRYDSLTGLPNRSFFLETLERTLARAARRRVRAAVIFVDLDGFKVVNDRLGHAAGDAVLQVVAERLRAGTRSSDLLSRIGGDEFTLIVQDLPRADDAALVARGLLERLARPCTVHDHEIPISGSAGIAVYPEDGTDAVDLLRHADLAMYRAKQDGKNTYRFFTGEMSERARGRMLLLDGLRAALDRDEFELVYLPVVQRHGPTVLEALLRWRHPSLGVVLPASFITQAEESGLILPIGARVLRTATRFLASLGRRDVRVAVNLSARQFLQPDLEAAVEEALVASGLAPDRLELELTEQAVMNDAVEVTDRLRRLRAAGVELTIDDFGTGYFSIARIRELGLRRLKIDRSLVCDLPGNRDHAEQTEAILALARSLGLEVVAEGVETEGQRAFLEERGCSGLQGYLLCPPLPPEDVPAFLAAHPVR
jgi:diguanylate cyclase (GGDEF)-like protein/PAS domain S-box-containing protein